MLRKKTMLINGLTMLLLAFACMTGGCASKDSLSAKSVRKNPTPELRTIAQTNDQRLNLRAKSKNYNYRMLRDDWEDIWFYDRPMRMSEYLIP